MKRAISMLVAIVMVLSMIPNVFAASETAIIVEDISSVAVELNADNGYYAEYSWTPSDNGELSLYQYTEKQIEMIVTQGDNSASSYNTEEGTYGFAVSLDVTAGEEVIIEVINANEEDETFEITGNFTKKAGTDQNNPIYLNALENVVDNKGTQWYAGYFSGTNMNITGPEGYTVTYNGEVTEDWWGDVSMSVTSANPRMPVVFAITGDGQFSISFAYPEGSSMNPAVLSTEMANYAYIEAGSQGYFYTWTAPAAGTLTLEFRAEDADWNPLGWSYQINNLTASAYGDTQWSDSDPVVNPAELTVAAGDEIQIVANTYDPANPWSAPAGDMYITATFTCETHGEPAKVDNNDGTHNVVCPACGKVFASEEHTFTEGFCACGAEQDGTETNPRDLTNDLLYEDDFTAVVTVPANTTFYCMAYRVNGMLMTINGGEGVTCTTDGMMMPYTWTIVNDSNEDAQYVIVVAAPVGSQDNPAQLTTGMANYAGVTEGGQGYFYTWTAPAAGTLTLEFYTEDADWNPLGWTYVVNNLTTYAYGDTQWSDSDPVVNPYELTVAAGDEIQIMANTYDSANPWTAPAGDLYVTASFACAEHGQTQKEDNYDNSTHNVNCLACGTTLATEAHTYVEGVCECGATMPGTETNPHDLTNDLLYEDDFTAVITVPANTTYYCMAYRVNGMVMTINGGAGVTCTTDGMMMPYTWTIVNDSDEAVSYEIVVTAPVGTNNNPEVLFRPNYINVNIPEGNNQGYFYKWTANAEGTLKLTCPTVEGVSYDVNMLNKSTYQQVWLQDSTDGTISLDVKAGEEVVIQVAVMPDENWNIPALSVALTGEFIFPIGHQMNPEILFRPSYINVNIPEGNTQGYFYKWTANADGELKLTCPAVEGVNYDVNMTNMSTYQQVWLQDSTDGTITLAVKAGDEIIIQVCALPDASWNTPALSVALTGEFIFPIGHQMNPEILFRPSYINVNIPEGNTQGYFYKWTANADGELKLTCPAVEGVNYDVNMTNMRTYAQAWLIDSTDGTITLAVKAGDEIIIQVCAMPDASWNTPALSVALTGEFIFPIGHQMNPETLTSVEQIHVNIPEGNTQGYFYKWTATANGELKLTCPAVEGVNYDVNMTNMRTYAQAWLIDSTDGTITLAVEAGDEVIIQVCAMPDASWNTPALNVTLTGGKAAAITAQPENVTVASGENATFTIATTGEVVSYQWQYKKLHVWFDTTMEGYNTDTLTVAANGQRNGYDYRCIVTFADGTKITSDAAEMTVETIINITDQPNDQLVALGYKGQFTVAAEGEGLKYQWEYKRPGSDLWINTAMEGATKPTVMIETTTARDGYQYRCVITDAAGKVAYSEAATMTVLSFTEHPAEVRTAIGATATFTVETNEAPVKYQWQYSRNGGETWTDTTLTGYNTATLTVDAIATRDGYQYRCVVTGNKESKVASKAATLYVGEAAVITAQPVSVTAAAGATATFATEATNAVAYQWQYSRNGGASWLNTSMTGATTDTLAVAVTASRNGYQYRCQITGTDGEVIYTNAATLTVG